MKVDKKAISYYYSFFEVSKELNQKQFYEFNMAVYKVMFFEEHIDNITFNDTVLTILWKSVKHSIQASVKGYCDKKSIPYDECFTPLDNPLDNPLANKNNEQEQEKEQGKEKEQEKEQYLSDENSNDLFIEYLELRKKMRLSNSKSVITRLLNKLETFSKIGHSKSDVISNAITSSWKDFYEPKQQQTPAHTAPTPITNEVQVSTLKSSTTICNYFDNHKKRLQPNFMRAENNGEYLIEQEFQKGRTPEQFKDAIDYLFSGKESMSFWVKTINTIAGLIKNFNAIEADSIEQANSPKNIKRSEEAMTWANVLRKQGMGDDEIEVQLRSQGLIA